MMPPLVTVADLEKRLGVAVGSLAGLDLARAEAALSDASALVRLAGTSDFMAPDGLTVLAPDAALVVSVRAAERAYRNPDNYQGESLGDGSYSWQAGQGDALVYLTSGETTLVRRAAGMARGNGGCASVRTPSAYYDPAKDPWAYMLNNGPYWWIGMPDGGDC
jgi:hypothetical protein